MNIWETQRRGRTDENVVVRFTPRPPAVGEDFTTVHSMQRWDALVADGYLTIKEPN